jgi:hypothetical protein
MRDGLWLVKARGIFAGFVIKDGMLVRCAPILRKRFDYWKTIAIWIGP